MYSLLTTDKVIVKDENAHNLYNKRFYGNLTESGLELSYIEALFLLNKGKIENFNVPFYKIKKNFGNIGKL